VRTVRRGLACGDYAISHDGQLVCAVERKTVTDLVSSLTSGRLRYALGELSALPRAAVVVEQSYARIFNVGHVPGAKVADRLAELQVGWPKVPIVYCDTRKLAENGPTATSPPPTLGARRTRSSSPNPDQRTSIDPDWTVRAATDGRGASCVGTRQRI
jgi:hypothetical protein